MSDETKSDSGEWGQRVYQDGSPVYWNNVSGGALVRFETFEGAKRACDESNKRYSSVLRGRESRPEQIPSGVTREPSEIEAVMMKMRDALRTGAGRTDAIRECNALSARLGWGTR